MGYLTSQNFSQGIPLELEDLLNDDPLAKSIFISLPPSHKNEYIAWIEEAKKENTRKSRAQKAISMLKKYKK